MRAATRCAVPGCFWLAVADGRCTAHRRIGGRPWRHLRAGVLARADYRCERCGADGPLDVHHRDPLVLGFPELCDPADLEALCSDCHAAERLRASL